MAKNPFDGLEMHINVETKEWVGSSMEPCNMCRNVVKYYTGSDEDIIPLILTYIENASLDEHKYFCSYECFEKWIDKFLINSNKE